MMTRAVMIVLLSLLTTYSDAACPITNCVQCNGNTCTSCNDGFWLESGECKQCPSHCALCTHSTQCQSCVTSYWNPGQLCNSVCSSNCTDSGCEDTSGNCNECYQGKYGHACNHDCSLCINGECDLRKCTTGCKDGYVQYSTEYLTCISCSSNCMQCSNATYCTQCRQGFYRDYYRNTFGRGTMSCKQCLAQCTKCTSNDQCPECNSECIKQGCDTSGVCVTTLSTSRTTKASSTKSRTTSKVTMQVTENYLNPTSANASGQTTHQSSVISTHQPICPNKCNDNCDEHGKCRTTTTSNSKLEDHYYEGFGHGSATGIGILIFVGTLIGVVIFFTRRTKCLRTICPTKSTSGSRENHVYVNTLEDAGTISKSSTRALHNVVNTNSEIHASLSEEDADSNRDYVSLGERQPENHYSDLQTNSRDDH